MKPSSVIDFKIHSKVRSILYLMINHPEVICNLDVEKWKESIVHILQFCIILKNGAQTAASLHHITFLQIQKMVKASTSHHVINIFSVTLYAFMRSSGSTLGASSESWFWSSVRTVSSMLRSRKQKLVRVAHWMGKCTHWVWLTKLNIHSSTGINRTTGLTFKNHFKAQLVFCFF